jgi:cell wall-associated NlpC family hydrolase
LFAADTYEPNDSFSTSYIVYSGSYNSYISTTSDNDYYKLWSPKNVQLKILLTNIPTNKDYNLELYNSSYTLVAYSRKTGNQNEEIYYSVGSSPSYFYIRVYSSSGYDSSNPYRLYVGYTTPKYAFVEFARGYALYNRSWYARPWDSSEGGNAPAPPPQGQYTMSIPISSGTPYSFGGKDLLSHTDTKFNTNSSYSITRWYDFWYPTSNRTVTYCSNKYSYSDSTRFSGETMYTPKGWVSVDCSGLVQRAAWLSGYVCGSTDYGRIGSFDSKGNILINTWGGEIGADQFGTDTYTTAITGWLKNDGTQNTGLSSAQVGDIVVFKEGENGGIGHVAMISAIYEYSQNGIAIVHSFWWSYYDKEPSSNTNYWRKVAERPLRTFGPNYYFQIRRFKNYKP